MVPCGKKGGLFELSRGAEGEGRQWKSPCQTQEKRKTSDKKRRNKGKGSHLFVIGKGGAWRMGGPMKAREEVGVPPSAKKSRRKTMMMGKTSGKTQCKKKGDKTGTLLSRGKGDSGESSKEKKGSIVVDLATIVGKKKKKGQAKLLGKTARHGGTRERKDHHCHNRGRMGFGATSISRKGKARVAFGTGGRCRGRAHGPLVKVRDTLYRMWAEGRVK